MRRWATLRQDELLHRSVPVAFSCVSFLHRRLCPAHSLKTDTCSDLDKQMVGVGSVIAWMLSWPHVVLVVSTESVCVVLPAASDASSEHSVGSQSTGAESISSRNTLLAGGSRSARKAAASSSALSGMLGKIGEQLSTMDTDFLHPEDLWKQPNKGCVACFAVVPAYFMVGREGGDVCV